MHDYVRYQCRRPFS